MVITICWDVRKSRVKLDCFCTHVKVIFYSVSKQRSYCSFPNCPDSFSSDKGPVQSTWSKFSMENCPRKYFCCVMKKTFFVKTCRFQVRLGGIIVVIYYFNLKLNRNSGQIEVPDYQILPAIRRIQIRTILLYWFNSSTKKNAIYLDVGISLEGKSLTGNNFSWVCVSVCVSVCLSVQMITFELLKVRTSFFVHTYIFIISRSSLSTKVIGSRSRSND